MGRIVFSRDENNPATSYAADIWQATDYYPFGMMMPERSVNMEELVNEPSYFIEEIETEHWTEFKIDQPRTNKAFEVPLDGSKWSGRVWRAGVEMARTVADSTTLPYFGLNSSNAELHLADNDASLNKMQIEYTIDPANMIFYNVGDSVHASFTVAFDDHWTNPRIEIQNSQGNPIKGFGVDYQVNNMHQFVDIGFTITDNNPVKILIISDFDIAVNNGTPNWTNAILLRNWRLNYYRKSITTDMIVDSSNYHHRPHYLYAFNGQERDDELMGEGNSYTATFWQYDARLGRRWNQDPKPNSSISNYTVFADNPLFFNDPNGDTLQFTWFTRTFQKEKMHEYFRELKKEVHEQTGLHINIGKKGVITYNSRSGDGKGEPTSGFAASPLARNEMLDALRSTSVVGMKFGKGGTRTRTAIGNNRGLDRSSTMIIDLNFQNSLKQNFFSNTVDATTVGSAMILYHELDHIFNDSWDPGQMSLFGNSGDPQGIAATRTQLDEASAVRTGATVGHINKIRLELSNSLNVNYGQRTNYYHRSQGQQYIYFDNVPRFGGGFGGATSIPN